MDPTKQLVLKLSTSPLILVHKENKTTTVELINSCFDQFENLSGGENFHLIVDLSDAKPPLLEIRHLIKLRYKKIEPLIRSLNIYVGSNWLIRIAVQFVTPILAKKGKVKVCKSVAHAVSEIKTRQ
jgi:hypothetical protein